MFEVEGEATPADILSSAASLRHARIEVDNAVLWHAVAWADRNGPETIHPDQPRIRGGSRPVQLGGDGTPQANDLAPAELGAALAMSTGAAAALVADSLDLCHRLPCLWAKIVDCSFPGWQGRKIAQHTRALTPDQAAQVDQRAGRLRRHRRLDPPRKTARGHHRGRRRGECRTRSRVGPTPPRRLDRPIQ